VKYLSPLRYPGGKAGLGPYFARLLSSQSIDIVTYCEPYAGGAGAGLFLLTEGHVDRLLINDLNPGIAAFWRASLTQPETFIDLLDQCRVDLDNWHTQRAIYSTPAGRDDLELGFATYFLNRTNRSGILSARPIGGLEQTGRWKIDARFNKPDLTARIRALAEHADQIEVRQQPATDLLAGLNRRLRPVFLYVDPPYIAQGDELYMTEHTWQDHNRLAALLRKSPHPWVLTYDNGDRIRSLYPDVRCARFNISHTAQTQKVGKELMFFSRGLRVPDIRILRDREGLWVA
jgi:DNA adenine methylase